MIPVMLIILVLFDLLNLILALVVIGGLLILQIALLCATKNHVLLHDLLSATVIVDKSSQMIFENADEMIKYKEQVSLQMANNDRTY